MSAALIGLMLLRSIPIVPAFNAPPTAASGCLARAATPRVIQVRVYSESRLSEPRLVPMLDTTNRVWRRYGVRVERASGDDALSVVVSDAPLRDTPIRSAALGSTLFIEGHATPNVRLSLGSAEELAAAMDMTPAFESRPRADRDQILLRMLGVALAHELGHYLIDTAHHARRGLLKSGISPQDLQGLTLSHLDLTDDQQRLVCQGGASVRHDN